jgi:hypothetical protein
MRYILLNSAPIAAAAIAGFLLLALTSRARLTAGRATCAFLGLAWLAAILAGALILAPVEAGGWTIALGSAFIIWIGFVLPALAIALVQRGVSVGAALLDAFLWLAIMLTQAAVMHVIGQCAQADAHESTCRRW